MDFDSLKLAQKANNQAQESETLNPKPQTLDRKP